MTQFVEFKETLRGFVRAATNAPKPTDDRAAAALSAEAVLLDADGDTLRTCVADDLVIAVDVETETARGGLRGVVRSGALHVQGVPPMRVKHGAFELFTRTPTDGRRLRYRLWLRDADGTNWTLSGTKLVTNNAHGGPARRAWIETTTLYVVLTPDRADDRTPSEPGYSGVLQVTIRDFARQLTSLRGEPGPAGGMRAVWRLVSFFQSVLAEVYLHDRADIGFAPGISAAFDEQ